VLVELPVKLQLLHCGAHVGALLDHEFDESDRWRLDQTLAELFKQILSALERDFLKAVRAFVLLITPIFLSARFEQVQVRNLIKLCLFLMQVNLVVQLLLN